MKTAPHAGFLQCRLAFGLLWLHLGQVFSLAAPAVCIGGMPRARAPRYKTGAEDTVFCRQLGAATGSAAAPYKNPGSLNRSGPSSYPPACSCTSEPGNSQAFAVLFLLFPPAFLCVPWRVCRELLLACLSPTRRLSATAFASTGCGTQRGRTWTPSRSRKRSAVLGSCVWGAGDGSASYTGALEPIWSRPRYLMLPAVRLGGREHASRY